MGLRATASHSEAFRGPASGLRATRKRFVSRAADVELAGASLLAPLAGRCFSVSHSLVKCGPAELLGLARFPGLAVPLLVSGPGKVCETQAGRTPKIGAGAVP